MAVSGFILKFYFLINDKRNLSTTGHGCRQLASSIHILECNNRKAASVFSSFKTCLASGDTALRCIDLRPTGGFDYARSCHFTVWLQTGESSLEVFETCLHHVLHKTVSFSDPAESGPTLLLLIWSSPADRSTLVLPYPSCRPDWD